MLMVSATASASVQACLQKNNKDIVRLWIFFWYHIRRAKKGGESLSVILVLLRLEWLLRQCL